MTPINKQLSWLAAGAIWAALSGAPALADDTELFVGNNLTSPGQPNILFVVDNSGSMGSLVRTQETYKSAVVYPSQGCDVNRVYWRTGTGNPPLCTSNNYFNAAELQCSFALTAFTTGGFYTDNMAQYDPTNGERRWETIAAAQKTRAVECQDDHGTHGNGGAERYARNGANTNGYWGNVGDTQLVSWGQNPAANTYTLYSGNYLNWYYGPTAFQTRLQVVQDVATDLLDSVNGVNTALMYFNDDFDATLRSEGGLVGHAMESISTARAPMQATINALTAETYTPLSETLYEAALYYSGGAVRFGNPDSVAASREPGNPALYNSPIEYSCPKNFVVFLTDGEPTGDVSADADIVAMQDHGGDSFGSLVGASCDVEIYPAGFNPSGGDCLDDLAEFMYEGDFSTLPGQQNVTTYTIGFTVDLPILADAATRGGGQYYTANDTATLATAMQKIVQAILTNDTTFTAPTVAVNAFNRTQNLSDLFVSVFKPSAELHWPGNLKKYRLRETDGLIVDSNDAPAVDTATGFFQTNAQSYWSASTDGAVVTAGGAANRIPDPPSRQVFTYLGTDDNLSAAGNRVAKANAALTDALLATGIPGDPTRDEVIDFINNVDLPNSTNPRRQMGDPLHSQPVSVIYGPGLRDGSVFLATNDGLLHAVDLQTGIEEWAFVPPEFLDDQLALYQNESAANKHYGIDGNLKTHMIADNDGIIETTDGEKVYLYFGMRRGGNMYYGLDITNRGAPELLFSLDGSDLPGVGQSWSTPVPTRMNIGGSIKLVLVIGGGYEPDQDNVGTSTDATGNSIYIVDAIDGSLLWHGSRDGLHKDFNAAGRAMDYSIPGDIRVIDLDGNGTADRMYAADMGGQVWRFDITNGQPAASLIAGGVIAQLGAAGTASPAVADVRRFYYAPDVAFVNNDDYNFIHVGIGSGHREHPLGLGNQDRFYALRDYGLGRLDQTQFNALTPIRDGDLTPIVTVDTNVPQGSPGWRLDLDDGGWIGEKVLAEARTFNNEVIFTTFRPDSSASNCTPQLGRNRVYRMSLFNGSPVANMDGSADPDNLTMSDLFDENQGGILPTAQAFFVSADTDGDGIPNSEDDDDDGDGVPDTNDNDSDGDGIPDDSDTDDDNDGIGDAQDDDDDGDGVKDEDEADDDDGDPLLCVGLICFPPGFENKPVRTFWSQESIE